MKYKFTDVDTLLRRTRKTPYGCAEWLGYCDQSGYPQLWHNKKRFIVTRLVMHLTHDFELSKKTSHQFVCHHCDNPSCINPEHLYIGDAKTNVVDAVKRKRYRTRTLTDVKIIQIFALHAKGTTPKEIAKHFDIGIYTIHSVLRRHSWKHVKVGGQ